MSNQQRVTLWLPPALGHRTLPVQPAMREPHRGWENTRRPAADRGRAGRALPRGDRHPGPGRPQPWHRAQRPARTRPPWKSWHPPSRPWPRSHVPLAQQTCRWGRARATWLSPMVFASSPPHHGRPDAIRTQCPGRQIVWHDAPHRQFPGTTRAGSGFPAHPGRACQCADWHGGEESVIGCGMAYAQKPRNGKVRITAPGPGRCTRKICGRTAGPGFFRARNRCRQDATNQDGEYSREVSPPAAICLSMTGSPRA